MTYDRIRDSDLASMIAWAETSNDLVLRALLELKERRNTNLEAELAESKSKNDMLREQLASLLNRDAITIFKPKNLR